MKFSKILLFVFAVALFSCSQEEDVTIDSRSGFHQKANDLSPSEVEALKEQCYKISISPEFLKMRKLSKDFAAKLKTKDADLTSRDNFKIWVTSNLARTTFASPAEALAMCDEIANAAGNVLTVNQNFYNSITRASQPQLSIILQPILIHPEPIVSTTSCYEACENDFNNQVAFEDYAYETNIAYANASSNAAIKKMSLGFAESGYIAGINWAVNSYAACEKACDNEW